jgi:hypothetical protein
LVQSFGQKRPVIPIVGGAAQVCARVAFDGLIQIRELARIADEEHRSVIAHHVPVSLFGIELQSKTTDIALGIGRTALPSYRSEAGKHLRLLSYLAENLSAGVLGDVVRDRECAEGTRSLGVHAALWDDLAHKTGQLFIQPDILSQ